MAVAVGLLGGFRVAVAGVPVHVGGRLPSLVIASLVLAEQRALSSERLIELVWGDDPPATARRTLQSYVADLRGRIGERSLLTASATGYVLSIARADVDLFAFADAVECGKDTVDADPLTSAASLSTALDSWAVPLDGLRPTVALTAVLAPYEALRLEALEKLNDVELIVDAARAVGRLEMLVREHPTRERFWAQLVRGLVALGRRDAALHAYQRARESLREHLGVDPGRLLLDAEQKCWPTGRRRPRRRARATASNLPAALSSLVGRDGDIATVLALLGEHRLVTLVGPGGCGKTRLALAAGASGAGRYVDGVWFVDLAPLATGEGVASRIAEVLGVEGDADDLTAALERRSALVILDNCEHVIAARRRWWPICCSAAQR